MDRSNKIYDNMVHKQMTLVAVTEQYIYSKLYKQK